MGDGDAGVESLEGVAAGGSALEELPGVCPARLTTKMADEMSTMDDPQRNQRGVRDDKDIPTFAEFMATLPPVWLAVSRSGCRPHERRIINQLRRNSAFGFVGEGGRRARR